MTDQKMNCEKMIEIKNANDIYTPLSVAVKELENRSNNLELRRKVEEFLNGSVPECLKDSPKAVLARHIASPNNEFFRYMDLAKLCGLEPRCLEYQKDKFRSENVDKYHLAKLYFCEGVGKKWGEKISAMKVIDFDKSEGSHFGDISTLWGESFIDFHHRILKKAVSCDNVVADESDWVAKNGKSPTTFYTKFLSLFLCFGILFEDYLMNKDEKEFTQKVVIPALNEVQSLFGIKPLIVKISPTDDENDLFWRYYPERVKTFVE